MVGVDPGGGIMELVLYLLLLGGDMNIITKEQELFLVSTTVAMEAEGEPYRGKLAVAYVIFNRASSTNKSVISVIFSPYAFSAWNNHGGRQRVLDHISDKVWKDSEKAASSSYYHLEPDPTLGATHYLNIPLTKKIRGGTLPVWVSRLKKTAVIDKHTFFKEKRR